MGHLFHSYVKQPSRVNPQAWQGRHVVSQVMFVEVVSPHEIYLYRERLINNIGGNYLYTLYIYISLLCIQYYTLYIYVYTVL